ncbi:MAG: hypothetical protein HZB29_01675 [Nitrospinae bacterium]|nr:hypothetical protein [Nitrospinota bacterium]
MRIKPDDLKTKLHEIIEVLRIHFDGDRVKNIEPRLFQYIGNEEQAFVIKYKALWEKTAKLMAAIELHNDEIRARTLKNTHPLNMQIHLENGVSNGVLVARTEKECADLVIGFLTCNLKFNVELEKDSE